MAKLLWNSAKIRLTCPEAFHVHCEIIEWGKCFSTDRIPEQAVGVDPLTAKLMKWVMKSWERVDFFNRYLLGTIVPRIQLDFIPALACAGHLLLRPADAKRLDPVATGIALQRLWLTTTSLGLYLQPEMTPIIFRWYVQAGRSISTTPQIDLAAKSLAAGFEALAGSTPADDFCFFCRVGHSARPKSRSTRKAVADLLISAKV